MDVAEILKSITDEDIERYRMIASIFGGGAIAFSKAVNIEQGIEEYESYAKLILEPKTIISIKTANRKLLRFFPGNRMLSTIDNKDAENVYRFNYKTAPLGAVNYNRVYKAMFNKFLDWNYVSKNSFKIKIPQRQKEEPIVISEIEINMICGLLRSKDKDVIADMVLLAVESGLRIAEEANLRWSDIDFKNKIITVGNKLFKTKTKRIRKIPFNTHMEEILIGNSARQVKNDKIIKEFVFTKTNGKPFMTDTISKTFKKVCRELGLPEEYHWHCLRSTAASNWVNKKVPIYTVQKLLGHTNVRTTQIYAKVDMEELRDAVNRL